MTVMFKVLDGWVLCPILYAKTWSFVNVSDMFLAPVIFTKPSRCRQFTTPLQGNN